MECVYPGNMKSEPAEQRCAGCGRAIECGMGTGKPCWCSTDFPAVMPLPDAAKGCYCRQCLAELIAARRRAPA